MCTHWRVLCLHGLKISHNLIGHTWSPYFPEEMGEGCMCTNNSNSPIKIKKAKNLQPK